MLCRLCIVEDNNYQKLEGAICDMLRGLFRKKFIQTNNPVICGSCVKKVEKAFDFKTTCLRTQKILSLYGCSSNKIVYVKDNKLCVSSTNDDALKLCRTCLRLIDNGFCSNVLGKYDIVEKLTMYLPEIVINDKHSTLICYKCSDHFRIFSELLNTINDAESMLSVYCTDNKITDTEQIHLADLIDKKPIVDQNSNKDKNMIKLLESNDHFLLDLENEFESTYLSDNMEDSKKRIIKKIIEEDVDLFYKEKPDFDLHDSFSEESIIDSDHGNTFFGPQPRQLLLSNSEDHQEKMLHESFEEEESSIRLSFEIEESSLSPGTLSDSRHFYECENQDERKKTERDVVSPNPFIFFNDNSGNDDRCSCDESDEATPPKIKRKVCERCKWKKALSYNSETKDTISDRDDVVVKKPKKDSKKKCRKAYGIEFKDLWCTQCRWKKACTRFGNTKAVSRR